MKNKNRGFTLAELLIVVAIVGVLLAISIPIFNKNLESSRESVDLSNVRSAYSEVMAAVISEDDEHAVKVVPLKQKIEKWQSKDPVTIAGITHSNNEGDTANWIGYPVAGGECEVSYQAGVGVILNWKGSTVKPDAPYPFNINCDLQKSLLDSKILERPELSRNFNFEIDSRCNTGSQLVAAIMDEVEKDPDNLEKYMAEFVDLQLQIHAKTAPMLTKLKDKLAKQINQLKELDATQRYELLVRLESMPKHTKVCHGDFNPSNVIVGEDGKLTVVDWAHVTQGNASADAALTYLQFALKNRVAAEMYLTMFCKKSDTAKQYVQQWFPIVAAAQLEKNNELEKDFLMKWIDVMDYQ